MGSEMCIRDRAIRSPAAAKATAISSRSTCTPSATSSSETLRTPEDIDTMAFPRIAAAAEAAWSPATGASDLRTWASFRERVGGLGPLWTSLGIGFDASDEIAWSDE